MSTYIFQEWPQADQLAQQLSKDVQAEVVIISGQWPCHQSAKTYEGKKLLQFWQQAKIYWQQQPVFAYPLNQGKFTLIHPEVYSQWCQYNAGFDQFADTSVEALKPWLQMPTPLKVSSVVIIGAGIAGAATAFALAQRNISVTVIEQNKIASAASGNHQGLLYAKISPYPTLQTELLMTGYGYSLGLLNQTSSPKLNCGVLHLNFNLAEELRNVKLAEQCPDSQLYQLVTRSQASTLAGIKLSSGGLWWPHGVTINPRSLIKVLLSHPLIKLLTHTRVKQLAHDGNTWQIVCQKEQKQHILTASHFVICAGAQSNLLNPLFGWPFQIIGGQTTTAVPGDYASNLRCALSGSSYISPVWRNKMCFGATFHPNCSQVELTQADEQANWQELSNWLPELAEDLKPNPTTQGHAALRCDTYDHLPVVGPIGESKLMLHTYEKLKFDKNYPIKQPCPWLPGAFVNTAHGSRGLATAPICAEAIAAAILGVPSPLSSRLQQGMHPNRLLIRTLTHYRNG